MTTFTKLWVVKSDHMVAPGSVLTVDLKGGSRKDVVVEAFVGSRTRKDGSSYYLYVPAQRDAGEAEAA